MNYSYIDKKILETLTTYNIKSFPIDCQNLLRQYGYRVCSYAFLQSKNTELYQLCLTLSNDALSDRTSKIIAYNERLSNGRIRFSLMHELGHIVLNHKSESPQNEQEANYFASHILAPRLIIYYAQCHSAFDVQQIFDLTYEASVYTFQDFSKWYCRIKSYGKKISATDFKLYQHFYDTTQKRLIWSIQKCQLCHNLLYNTRAKQCSFHSTDALHFASFLSLEDHRNLKQLEHQWLYGNDL